MTVKVAKRVLNRWRELSAESHKATVELLLTSRLDPAAATEALSQSLDRAIRAFESAHVDVPPGEDVPFAGEWDVAQVPEGALLVGGRKSDAFESVLEAIVDDLVRQGVRGKLDLYGRPEVPSLPFGVGAVTANVRVLGRRVVNSRDRWAADRSALDRVVEAAVDWCLECRPERAVTLQHDVLPPLIVRRCDSPLERLRDVLHDYGRATLSSIGDECFRDVQVRPGYGLVTVTEGGPVLHRAGWRPSVAAAAALVRHLSADAVYAHVRRVASILDAHTDLHPDRLPTSWFDATAHEERLVPDAFGIQLLGQGHAGRIPAGEDWRRSDLGGGRVMLEHADPAAWFGELTLEQAMRGESIPSARLLERARASFGPLLFEEIAKEERARMIAWEMEHPHVRLSEDIVAKVHALPPTPYVGHWDVALVLRDGRVVEDVELGSEGAIVSRVGGEREFELDPAEIVDVLDRS